MSVTHCHIYALYTLQHTAMHYNMLQHTAAHSNKLQQAATALHLTLLMHASHSYVSFRAMLVLFYFVQENLEIFARTNWCRMFKSLLLKASERRGVSMAGLVSNSLWVSPEFKKTPKWQKNVLISRGHGQAGFLGGPWTGWIGSAPVQISGCGLDSTGCWPQDSPTFNHVIHGWTCGVESLASKLAAQPTNSILVISR